jgi:hypothetical protein
MQPRIRTGTPQRKVSREVEARTDRKDARISFACMNSLLEDVEREAAYRRVTRGEMVEARVAALSGIDPKVIDLLKHLGDQLSIPLRIMISTAIDTYLGYRLGVARIVPRGAVKYEEFKLSEEGLVTGMKRVVRLTEDFAKRERLLWFAVFSLIPQEERTEAQEAFCQAVREDAALMREVEDAMTFSPKAEG